MSIEWDTLNYAGSNSQPEGYTAVEDTIVTAEEAVADVTQVRQDAQKVVSPYYQDSIEIHPDAKKKEERINLQMTVSSPSKGTSAEEDSTYVEKVYDFGNWLWGLVFPEDEVEQGEQRPEESKELEELLKKDVFGKELQRDIKPEEFHRFIDEMRQLVHRIQDYNAEFADDVNFEALLAMIFKAQIEERQEEAATHHEKIVQDLIEQRQVSKERLEKMNEMVSRNQSSEMWGMFDKLASGLGVVASGASVASGVGVVVFLVGVGLTADSMFDDKGKRALAGLFAGGNEEKQDKYTEYLKLGAGVATLGIFMGLSGKESLTAAANITRGAATIGNGYSKHSSNLSTADLRELGGEADKKSSALKKDGGKINSLVKNVHEYYKNLSDIVRNQQETFIAVAR